MNKSKNQLLLNSAFLLLILSVMFFPIIQYMALDIDSRSIVEIDQSYLEYMKDWIQTYGVNRIIGQGLFLAFYKIDGVLAIFQFAFVLTLLARYLFIITALKIMHRDQRDSLFLLSLSLVAPFWLDSALLFARSLNELLSAIFFFLFFYVGSKNNISGVRVAIFCLFQSLVYEVCLIPAIALIWYCRKDKRMQIVYGVGAFILIYITLIKLHLLNNPKLASSSNQVTTDISIDSANGIVAYATKSDQIFNTINDLNASIGLIAFCATVIFYTILKFILRNWKSQPISNRISIKMLFAGAFCLAPIYVNLAISFVVGNQGRIYWMVIGYSWLLLVLFFYFENLIQYSIRSIQIFLAIIFLFSSILVMELRFDLQKNDTIYFSKKLFRGFTSHFGYYDFPSNFTNK